MILGGEPRHVHTFDHDTTTTPDHAGTVEVTEWCACGRPIATYLDTVL